MHLKLIKIIHTQLIVKSITFQSNSFEFFKIYVNVT